MLILRSAATSPFVRKVRIAAAALGLDDRIEISAADTADPNDSLRRQNPLGKVPALILESGEVLYDSAVILEYLDMLAGGGKIIPTDPPARFRSLTQAALADGMMEATLTIRFETLWRAPEMRSPAWVAHQEGKIARALEAFEKAPPDELADIGAIALACALGYLDLRLEGRWRADHPRLVGWLDAFADAAPSFEATRFTG